jgi:hypothetical protein
MPSQLRRRLRRCHKQPCRMYYEVWGESARVRHRRSLPCAQYPNLPCTSAVLDAFTSLSALSIRCGCAQLARRHLDLNCHCSCRRVIIMRRTSPHNPLEQAVAYLAEAGSCGFDGDPGKKKVPAACGAASKVRAHGVGNRASCESSQSHQLLCCNNAQVDELPR